VSTAAPSPLSAGFSIARAQSKCSVCGRDIAPGEKFTAAVRESAAGLERLDLDSQCWQSFDRAALLAFWQVVMPAAAAPKPRMFVDDTVLCELFERLQAGGEEAPKLNFRFVLGLILMRKRLLAYESAHVEGGKDFWTVRLKGRDQSIDLLNPRLDEQQVAEVTAQIGQILSGEQA
jgi:hypothetical protein